MFRSPRNIQPRGRLPQSSNPRLQQTFSWAARQQRTRSSILFSSFITTRTASSSLTGKHPIVWPRRVRNLFYAGIFGGLGFYLGSELANRMAPPLVPGTEEDVQKMKQIRDSFESLPVVKELRSDPAKFREWEAYSSFSGPEKQLRLTSGTFKGSRGLALQRIFWNEKERKSASVVFFGPGLEGWPTLVHGGVLATILDENLGRVALWSVPARTGVTANLNVNYKRPVFSGNFYTVHVDLDRERSTDRKAYVIGEIRDLSGKVCVKATGLFVVPKGLPLRQLQEHF